MKIKYAVWRSRRKPGENKGRKMQPRTWEMDRYYAYLKHRAQARFRGEQYELTVGDWCELWDETAWSRRGRRSEDLSLFRLDPYGAWEMGNVVVDQNCYKGQYYAPDRPAPGRPRKN